MNDFNTLIHDYVVSQFRQPGSHGLDHTIRVTSLCYVIGTEERADMQVLLPAAMLHDIARSIEDKTGIPHEIEGARMAESFLISIRYPQDLIPGITSAIRTHRFSTSDIPHSLEGWILSDADKLDATGAVGLARAFITSGERGGDISDAIDHIDNKLLKLADMMHTRSARQLASTRHDLVSSFLTTLINEMKIHDGLKKGVCITKAGI